jgi:hypothetical protein
MLSYIKSYHEKLKPLSTQLKDLVRSFQHWLGSLFLVFLIHFFPDFGLSANKSFQPGVLQEQQEPLLLSEQSHSCHLSDPVVVLSAL